jgi:hypothetical protein
MPDKFLSHAFAIIDHLASSAVRGLRTDFLDDVVCFVDRISQPPGVSR